MRLNPHSLDNAKAINAKMALQIFKNHSRLTLISAVVPNYTVYFSIYILNCYEFIIFISIIYKIINIKTKMDSLVIVADRQLTVIIITSPAIIQIGSSSNDSSSNVLDKENQESTCEPMEVDEESDFMDWSPSC